MGIVIAFIIFSVMVLIHEFGHFLLAKRNGIVVTEFSLGMGPRIVSTVKGGTRYSWKVFPFGGSCMMLGADGEDTENNAEGTFNSKGVWARISVIAAGPIFNFFLAFVGAVIVIGTVGYDSATVSYLDPDSPEAAAGLQEGDLITEFQGKKIYISRDLSVITSLDGLDAGETTLTYERDGKEQTITYTPYSENRYMLGFSYSNQGTNEITELSLNKPLEKAGLQIGDLIIGINGTAISDGAGIYNYFQENPLGNETVVIKYQHNGNTHEVIVTPEMTTYTSMGFYYYAGREKLNPIGVLKYSCIEVGYWIKLVFKSLGMLFTGQFSVNDLSGPVGVVDVIDDTYQSSKSEGSLITWMNLINLMILLSANLGVMNLLPLPALDGGRLVFLILEAIRGKAVNRQVEGIVHFAGLVLLMALMVFIMFNDIRKIF